MSAKDELRRRLILKLKKIFALGETIERSAGNMQGDTLRVLAEC
jgi:translation initiation factor 1 (eIF-1/SUI1)